MTRLGIVLVAGLLVLLMIIGSLVGRFVSIGDRDEPELW